MTCLAANSSVRMAHSDVVLDALQAEFGAVMAARILEAEALDFLWNARVKERYLGQYLGCECSSDDGEDEFSRVAILSFLSGGWHVALCLVDGEGVPIELLWKQQSSAPDEADFALQEAC